MKVLTPEQAMKLIEEARGDRLEAVFVLAVTTGMRQGELLGLRWSAVDLEKGTLQVQVALQRTKGGYELVPPKTKRSRRLVMLTEVAGEALERHRTNQTAERLLAGDHWKNELDLVFTNQSGGPLDGTPAEALLPPATEEGRASGGFGSTTSGTRPRLSL